MAKRNPKNDDIRHIIRPNGYILNSDHAPNLCAVNLCPISCIMKLVITKMNDTPNQQRMLVT